jgi:hypothetical protein
MENTVNKKRFNLALILITLSSYDFFTISGRPTAGLFLEEEKEKKKPIAGIGR